MDNQIKDIKCLTCGAKTQPGIVLLNVMGGWYCGNCYMKIQEKTHKIVHELFEGDLHG